MTELTTMQEEDQRSTMGKLVVPVVIVLLLAGLVALAVKTMGKGASGGQKRQTVKIAVLPDTPPPPPPPKIEKKPEPEKQEDKPQQQAPQQQPDTPPEPAPIKMEGAAGNGESMFRSGSVTSEYKAGDPSGNGGGGVATVADRLTAMTYANTATRSLNSHLNQDQSLRKAGDYKVAIKIWVTDAGALERFDLVGTTGKPEVDELIKASLQRFKGLRSAPPPNMTQPIRLQLTNRMTG